MKVLKLKLLLACALALLLGVAPLALGDWDEGDGHKMHYPQLPKEDGWDVAFNFGRLADDWQCSQTGPVEDIHFWVSWEMDMVEPINGFSVRIWSDDPCGLNGYSEPNEPLWERDLDIDDFTVRDMPDGLQQGWFDPYTGFWVHPDHVILQQINIDDIDDPFIQQQGEIYWLEIDMWGDCGWKESASPQFRDDAVFWDSPYWVELIDPEIYESMDLAFVITGGEEEEVVKWEQPPCLDDPNCMDVDATDDDWMTSPPQALADDFNCTTTGLITDIHIWGSWLFDYPPYEDPNHVWFTLCIYSNDPCGPMGWSEPNELLWTRDFHEGEFDVEIFAEGPEAYYIPCEPAYMPDNHFICWLYSFYIDPCEAFVQEESTIYWLALQAHFYELTEGERFGWKNSSEQWNDDAVWTEGYLPYDHGPWEELRHPMTGDSVDLAFKITTVEEEEVPAKPPVPHLKWSQPPIEKLQPTGTGLLYGSSTHAGTMSLVTVNPITGLVTIIGPFAGAAGSITEIEWSPDGSTLYATTGGGASTIHTIDPSTGAVLSTVAQIPAGGALQGLEFNATGVLLGTLVMGPGAPSDLVTVNTTTGVLTTIGPTGFGPIGGLAFDSGFNTLYGITSGLTVPPILLTVNPNTGAAVQIAVTTMNAEASSLEFTADGRLVTAGNDGNFYEINPTTGVATFIGPLANEPKLSGLSLRPTPPVYWGWDQLSYTNDPCCEHGFGWQVVADDFRCLGSMPIKSIHWWGSHFGWEDATQMPPVSELPVAWLIGFWSNVPAYADPDPVVDFSYPKELLWQIEVPADRVDFDQVGTDEFCGIYPYDVAYQYTLYLEPEEYFWQEDFEPNTIDNIFWLSIVALYPEEYEPLYPWGWKTRPWSWMDDAVTFSCEVLKPDMVLDPYSIMPIKDPLYGESYDVAFELDTDPNWIKWEQPFTGIRDWPHYEDELSIAETYEYIVYKWIQWPDLDPTGMDVLAGPRLAEPNAYEKFLADDFNCTSSGPITDIHIWASYNEDIRLTDVPWFSLVIYENVPADACVPYSRPGAVLWDAYLQPTYNYEWGYAEELFYDPNPDEIIGFDSIVWRFDFDIDPDEAFVQEEGEIYWLGVHHSFDLDGDRLVDDFDLMLLTEMQPGVFGWKTSLDHFEDDAVWTDVDTFMGPPHVVPSGEIWKELRYPINHPFEGRSIDLAFEITTKEEELYILQLTADDWLCERRTPVTALAWWGSYMGYEYSVGHIEEIPSPMPLPVKPDYFLLYIWTDVPASGGDTSGNCCTVHSSPGCDDPNCEASVCSYDPYCCEVEWDSICVDEAQDDPNCDCARHSHPGHIIWEYKAYDYDEVLVGYDKHPLGESNEPVFRYSVRLLEEDWFHQPDYNEIFWLSVVAVYNYDESIPNYDWGWTNHKHMFNDDAVGGYLYMSYGPDEWSWYELYDQTGETEDMSFILFTDPTECSTCANYNCDWIVNFFDYADFADDWYWVGPAGGYNNSDLNCDGVVDYDDLKIFAQQWLTYCP